MNCSGCLQLISKEEEYIVCSTDDCVKVFHKSCANIFHLSPGQLELWTCPDCRAMAKKGGDNTDTPVRQNVTLRDKSKATSSGRSAPPELAPVNLNTIASDIRLIRQDMVKMQSDFAERFDTILTKLLDCDTRLKSLEEIKKENEHLKLQVTQLQDQINKQAHASLQSELEIVGISETPNENPYHLVLTTANKIGLDLDERDLSYVSRAGPRIEEKSKDGSSTDRLPRPLVVSFTRRSKRDDFINKAKSRKSLDSRDILVSGPQRRVYVNERLTSDCRRLFRSARNFVRENGFKYCWTRNGKVYIRKGEGKDGSPPIHVRDFADLERMSASKVK